jgi:hypothetical protein
LLRSRVLSLPACSSFNDERPGDFAVAWRRTQMQHVTRYQRKGTLARHSATARKSWKLGNTLNCTNQKRGRLCERFATVPAPRRPGPTLCAAEWPCTTSASERQIPHTDTLDSPQNAASEPFLRVAKPLSEARSTGARRGSASGARGVIVSVAAAAAQAHAVKKPGILSTIDARASHA